MKLSPSVITLLAALASSPIWAGTVTTTADNGPGSLRAILAAAVDTETIDFSPGLAGATITLTSGSLTVGGKILTIDASALPSGIRLSGNNATRVFTINAGSDITLRNLHVFNGRESSGFGGGVFAYDSSLLLEDCSIINCYSKEDGGGLWGNTITGVFNRCTFAGNEAGNAGGGVFLIGLKSAPFTSCQISGNRGGAGGGVYNLRASPTFTNCTIQGNTAAGVRNERNSAPIFLNCIVWGNTASGGTLAHMQIQNFIDSIPTVEHSLVEGASGASSFSHNNDGSSVIWGDGNLNGTSTIPGFVSPVASTSAPNSTADLRLVPGSPAIDAGESSPLTGARDLAGKTRIQGTEVDLGAFEGSYINFAVLHPGISPSGDENSNGVSNFLEYALGRDPAAPGSAPPSPAISKSGSSVTLTFRQRDNATDLEIAWETSSDLRQWSPLLNNAHYQTVSSTVSSSGQLEANLRVTGGDAKRFYRQRFVQK